MRIALLLMIAVSEKGGRRSIATLRRVTLEQHARLLTEHRVVIPR